MQELPDFPEIKDSTRLERLEPPAGKVNLILDTDTYNEIDDQFALAYSLICKPKLKNHAVYAAPFHNYRSDGPADGMIKSYDEIIRVMAALGLDELPPVYKGSESWLPAADKPVASSAAEDLIKRAHAADGLLYVAAIGAVTNVASAILLDPSIINKIVVVWLSGHARHWPHTQEFNIMQDLYASRVILDSGVPLVIHPCEGVVSHLHTTEPEMKKYVDGKGTVGNYLYKIFNEFCREHKCLSKVIWDITTIAWLLDSSWYESELVSSPILNDNLTWSFDNRRHLIRSVFRLNRDAIFRDLFSRIK
ncbi:MAG TPA: nucleoside hydrolase [Spirochaetota bacterium]|nr:nucleoside hydrolase [Spirochaetota bacterium]